MEPMALAVAAEIYRNVGVLIGLVSVIFAGSLYHQIDMLPRDCSNTIWGFASAGTLLGFGFIYGAILIRI